MTTTENADRRIRLAYATGQLDITGLAARLTTLASGYPAATTADGLPDLPPAESPHAFPRRPFPADPAVLAELAGIRDPRGRFRRAVEIIETETPRQEDARLRRLTAAAAAHVRYGASQVSCYAPLGMTRRNFSEKVKQLPATLPVYGDPALNARATELAAIITSGDESDARTLLTRADLAAVNARLAAAALDDARHWHEIYAAHRSKADIARLVRDREIRALTSGAYGPKVRAVRLAEDSGYDPAMLSQIINTAPAA